MNTRERLEEIAEVLSGKIIRSGHFETTLDAAQFLRDLAEELGADPERIPEPGDRIWYRQVLGGPARDGTVVELGFHLEETDLRSGIHVVFDDNHRCVPICRRDRWASIVQEGRASIINGE